MVTQRKRKQQSRSAVRKGVFDLNETQDKTFIVHQIRNSP